MELAVVFGVAGVVLILVGLIGGGFTYLNVSMPRVGRFVRVGCFAIGSLFLIFAMSFALSSNSPRPEGFQPTPPPPQGAGFQPTPPPPQGASESTESTVNFSINDRLGGRQVSETVVVNFGGRELGRLKVDPTATTDSLSLNAKPGEYAYELDVVFWYRDQNGEVQEVQTGGKGTIEVYEGARYAVVLVPRGDSLEVSLRDGASSSS